MAYSATSLRSSAIRSFRYNGATRNLAITFPGGATYIYFDVDFRTFVGLVGARSRGSYFNSAIRNSFESMAVPGRLLD